MLLCRRAPLEDGPAGMTETASATAQDLGADRDAAQRRSALRHQVRELTGSWLAAGRYTPRSDCWLRSYDLEFSREVGAQGLIGLPWAGGFGRRRPGRTVAFGCPRRAAARWSAGSRPLDRRSANRPGDFASRQPRAAKGVAAEHHQRRVHLLPGDERAAGGIGPGRRAYGGEEG